MLAEGRAAAAKRPICAAGPMPRAQDVAGGIDVADNKRKELTEPTSTQVEESREGQRRTATE